MAPGEQVAGRFSTWLRVIGDVPCGTCIACCRASLFIHVRPEETKHIPKALLFPAPGAPKGHKLMGFNERGECPMLKNERCSIYEHRPQTCRAFDCRVLTAANITPDQPEIAARARTWRFEFAEDDRELQAAVQAAAKFFLEQRALFPEGALPRNEIQLALLAVRVCEIFLDAALSPPELVARILAAMSDHGAGGG